MKEKTWAVVVNWNGGEANLSCLRSLGAEGLPAERVVFVDNASTDGSREEVERAFPGLRVVRNETNEGYGHATNRGAELVFGPFSDPQTNRHESAALGGMGIEGGNPVRTESILEAARLDRELHQLWSHHPKVKVVSHQRSFYEKVGAGLEAIRAAINGE